ncbi:MAG: O-antigen ligase family protein [Acetobacteraceae bacterium]
MIGQIATSRPPDKTRWRPFASRDLGLIVGALLLTSGVFIGSIFLSNSFPWAPYIPLGLVALGLAGWVVLAAIYASPTAIMLYLGVVVFVTDGGLRIRAPGDDSLDWQSFLKFFLWLGAGVIGFAHIPPVRQLLARPACAGWLAYLCVALASSIYSPTPAFSFASALGVSCIFAFSFSLTRHLSEGQILWTILVSLTIFNVGGWIVYYTIPALGISEAEGIGDLFLGARMAGLAGQATGLGSVCSVAVGAAFVLWYTGRAKPVTSLILGGFAYVTLMRSDARTAEIATVAAIALILASRSAWLTMGVALAGTVAVLVLQISPGLTHVLEDKFSRSGDPGEISSLTGRTQIWEYAWRKIAESPILGYGYDSPRVVIGHYLGFENSLLVGNAHNLFLQNLLCVGALGTIPLVMVFGYLVYRMVKKPIPIVYYTIVWILVTSLTYAEPIGTTPTLITILMFIASAWPGLEGSHWGLTESPHKRVTAQAFAHK